MSNNRNKNKLPVTPKGFHDLVLCHQYGVFRYLSGFNIPPARTEELAQETFLRAYENLQQYDEAKGASFSTWLYVIAKRLAINEINRYENKQATRVALEPDELEATTESVSKDFSRQKDKRLVFAAIKSLPEESQSALLLSYVSELSLKQIAEIEQCSLSAVKSRIHRAKSLLRSLLTGTLESDHD